jgi:hypothetical protein
MIIGVSAYLKGRCSQFTKVYLQAMQPGDQCFSQRPTGSDFSAVISLFAMCESSLSSSGAFIPTFSNQNSRMRKHSGVQYADEFARTNYLIKVKTYAE